MVNSRSGCLCDDTDPVTKQNAALSGRRIFNCYEGKEQMRLQ
jgi:hypothetical protein